jgi:hypothetical protein
MGSTRGLNLAAERPTNFQVSNCRFWRLNRLNKLRHRLLHSPALTKIPVYKEQNFGFYFVSVVWNAYIFYLILKLRFSQRWLWRVLPSGTRVQRGVIRWKSAEVSEEHDLRLQLLAACFILVCPAIQTKAMLLRKLDWRSLGCTAFYPARHTSSKLIFVEREISISSVITCN